MAKCGTERSHEAWDDRNMIDIKWPPSIGYSLASQGQQIGTARHRSWRGSSFVAAAQFPSPEILCQSYVLLRVPIRFLWHPMHSYALPMRVLWHSYVSSRSISRQKQAAFHGIGDDATPRKKSAACVCFGVLGVFRGCLSAPEFLARLLPSSYDYPQITIAPAAPTVVHKSATRGVSESILSAS